MKYIRRPGLINLDFADVKTTMNAFYAIVKALDEHLRFVFITGVSKFSKVSAFPSKESLFKGSNGIQRIVLRDKSFKEINIIQPYNLNIFFAESTNAIHAIACIRCPLGCGTALKAELTAILDSRFN